MKELTDFLDKRGVEYTIDGEHVLVPGDVRLICPELTHLPESFGNLKIGGGLHLDCPKLRWNQRRVQMSDDAATAISFLMGLAALFLWGWAR